MIIELLTSGQVYSAHLSTRLVTAVTNVQRGSDVVTKDALLPLEVLQDLGNEANGVLDFLVLMRTTKLVGFLGSTFSQQLRLYRSLAGMNPNTTVLVGDIEQNGEEHTPEVQVVIDAGLQVLTLDASDSLECSDT